MEIDIGNQIRNNEKRDQKPKMYDTLAMITTVDDNKNILITTIQNTVILGKLSRTSPYELEIEVKGKGGKNEKIIVMKHFIATVKFV